MRYTAQEKAKIVLEHACDLQAVPWLRRLVAGLSPRRPGFDADPSGRAV